MGIHVLSNKSFRYITTKKPNHQTKPAWHRTSAEEWQKNILFKVISCFDGSSPIYCFLFRSCRAHTSQITNNYVKGDNLCWSLGIFSRLSKYSIGHIVSFLFHSWLFKKKKSIISNNKMFTMVSVSFSQQVGLKASFIISFASVVIQKVEWFSRHWKWSLQQFECFI